MTLKELLVRRHGYRQGDFGSAGFVRVDFEEGTISPVSLQDIFTPRRSPARVVRLAALFRPGQEVTVKGVGRIPARRFKVIEVGQDGLTVETPEHQAAFLGWPSLRHGLSRPELIVLADTEAADASVRPRPSAPQRPAGPV